VRADLPYIIHWDYKLKYEVGSLNPVVEFLRNQPYEHRVAILPFEPQQQLRGYDYLFGGDRGLYGIEWTQHLFPFYNIQCLDLIQMARMPEDLVIYRESFVPRTESEVSLYARHWQLTNTRYLLGAAGFLDILNQQLDPGQNRFRIVQRFDLTVKPGVIQASQLADLTAVSAPDGDLALFEFTGALPRIKLYSNWQVNTNDAAVLKTLTDMTFDPTKSVLVDTPQTGLADTATGDNSGSVDFKSYAPERIVIDATATSPSVLLLNDRYDPHWKVTVDGKPAQLLRCNFVMRGVYLAPGTHTVGFAYILPNRALYLTLSAAGAGLLLGVFLGVRRCQGAQH
jgi:Bacterial membrane protein YfhO